MSAPELCAKAVVAVVAAIIAATIIPALMFIAYLLVLYFRFILIVELERETGSRGQNS
jgi:hypothetical protein